MTKNDRWKLLIYGWRNYIHEAIITMFSLVMLIYAIAGAYYGFNKFAIICASMSAALLFGMMLSYLCSRSVLTKGELLKFYTKKFLSEKWSTDLDGIKIGCEYGAHYLVVFTAYGFIVSGNVYNTKHELQAEELRKAIDMFRKYNCVKIHYIKVIDLLKLSFDAEEIRHELE